jgi:uncharacterized protein YyaL (SSP411 family)
MEGAAQWLARAQDATLDDGVAALYSLREGWDRSYPETTGYIIPTFIGYSHLSEQPIWRERAERMADWLLTTQLSDGGFPCRTDLETPLVFDTGQVILGLVGAFRELGTPAYLEGAKRGARWLTSVQEPTGVWLSHSYGGFGHAYHTRVAWALLEVYAESGEGELLSAARKQLSWAMAQQLDNGWFRSNAFTVNGTPSLHTIAYAARGLLEAGVILGEPRYLWAARKTADALLSGQGRAGALRGEYDSEWRSTAGWSCLTGNAQTAIIWLKLYALDGDEAYLTAARQAIAFLKVTQNLRAGDGGVRGGIKGSHPLSGGYAPYTYPNWATKFFLDALMLEARVSRWRAAKGR